jgi:sarcosine oxidase subunit alpha
MAAGEEYSIAPYGTEAMHVLRAEKGFVIVGQETDGTMTPQDLGFEWIIGKTKPDFIGRRSHLRSDTKRPDRKHLVGLLTENPNEVLLEGAQVVEHVKDKPPMTMIGHVTSGYYSPNAGRSIAMAVIKDGRNRMGQTVYLPYEGKVVAAKISKPTFLEDGAPANG